MASELTKMSCEDFASVLAARQPVPGGGGAAAYVGALGVALGSMVGTYTSGKKSAAAYEGDIRRMLLAAEDIRVRLVALVDADADAFYPLSQAYAIPKDDPTRADVLESATRNAIVGPMASRAGFEASSRETSAPPARTPWSPSPPP